MPGPSLSHVPLTELRRRSHVIAMPGAPELVPLAAGLGSEAAIVAIAPGAEVADRISGLEAGADDCLSAPFHLAELSARVSAACRRWAVRAIH